MGYDWDMRAAEAAFSRAIEVGPNGFARGYSGLGYTLAVQGRLVEGLKQSLRGAELEPLTPIWTANTGMIYRWMRNEAGATEEVRKSLEVEPHFLLSRLELGRVHLAAGRLYEAVQEFERAVVTARKRIPSQSAMWDSVMRYWADAAKPEIPGEASRARRTTLCASVGRCSGLPGTRRPRSGV